MPELYSWYVSRETLEAYGGLAEEVGFDVAFINIVGVDPSFFDLPIDTLPQLSQFAESLWLHGHWSAGMIFCTDCAIAEQLRGRYGADISDLIALGFWSESRFSDN